MAQHQDDVTIQRLRRNKQLTALDLSKLERILLASGLGSREDLDRDAVEEAVAEFVAGTTLPAQQLDFPQVLTNHLVENGKVNPAALFDSQS